MKAVTKVGNGWKFQSFQYVYLKSDYLSGSSLNPILSAQSIAYFSVKDYSVGGILEPISFYTSTFFQVIQLKDKLNIVDKQQNQSQMRIDFIVQRYFINKMYSKYLDYTEAATRANYAAQAENEQKDILISSLKQDLYELRQLESDFHRLNQLIINLQGKYSLLLDEKDRSEKEQRIKSDIDKSTIMQLKDEIDAVRIQLQRITAECDDLQRDNTGMKRMSDARAGQIQNIRYEIKAAEAKNQRANDQNRNLSVTVKGLKEERKRLEDQCDNLSALLDANIAKLKNIEKHVRNSQSGNARLDKTLHQAESDNAKLVAELKQRSDETKRAENKLKSLRNNIDELQLNFRNVSQQAEKNKADSGNNAANLQNQVAKGKQLTAKIQSVEGDIYAQQKEIDVINIETQKLRRQHADNLNRNKFLNEEVDKLLALINEYETVNKELVDEIEIYMDQDEQARSILNRRQNMKEIIESTMRKVALTGEPIKHLKY